MEKQTDRQINGQTDGQSDMTETDRWTDGQPVRMKKKCVIPGPADTQKKIRSVCQ